MSSAKPVPDTVTVHISFRPVKRGGRKEIQLPPGTLAKRKMDNTLVKAPARAFRWKRMLDSGEYTTIAELAKAEVPLDLSTVCLVILEPRRSADVIAKSVYRRVQERRCGAGC